MQPDERRRAFNTPETACIGKVKYDTAAQAAETNHAIQTKSRGKNRNSRNHTYRCEFCKKWHIGRANKWKTKRTRQYFSVEE